MMPHIYKLGHNGTSWPRVPHKQIKQNKTENTWCVGYTNCWMCGRNSVNSQQYITAIQLQRVFFVYVTVYKRLR